MFYPNLSVRRGKAVWVGNTYMKGKIPARLDVVIFTGTSVSKQVPLRGN